VFASKPARAARSCAQFVRATRAAGGGRPRHAGPPWRDLSGSNAKHRTPSPQLAGAETALRAGSTTVLTRLTGGTMLAALVAMLKAALVLALAAAAGCTPDAPAPSSAPAQTGVGGSAAPAAPGAPAGRSAKIDVPPRRPLPRLADAEAAGEDPRPTREERLARRMARLDTDGDGVISDEERAALRAQRRAELQARLDRDGDGTVTDAERLTARLERAEAMTARLDADGDGALTIEELENAPRFRRLDPAAADGDGDGVLSVDELAKALEANGWRRGPWQRGPRSGSASGGPREE
jgi:Ca2+-binding EF-hand superfamily protein